MFDCHQQIDGLLEQEKGKQSLGTTKKGIGPTYAAKVSAVAFCYCCSDNSVGTSSSKLLTFCSVLALAYVCVTCMLIQLY